MDDALLIFGAVIFCWGTLFGAGLVWWAYLMGERRRR